MDRSGDGSNLVQVAAERPDEHEINERRIVTGVNWSPAAAIHSGRAGEPQRIRQRMAKAMSIFVPNQK
jgi:hypothetical protein